jgi:hypothetical protein
MSTVALAPPAVNSAPAADGLDARELYPTADVADEALNRADLADRHATKAAVDEALDEALDDFPPITDDDLAEMITRARIADGYPVL